MAASNPCHPRPRRRRCRGAEQGGGGASCTLCCALLRTVRRISPCKTQCRAQEPTYMQTAVCLQGCGEYGGRQRRAGKTSAFSQAACHPFRESPQAQETPLCVRPGHAALSLRCLLPQRGPATPGPRAAVTAPCGCSRCGGGGAGRGHRRAGAPNAVSARSALDFPTIRSDHVVD